MPRLGLLNMFIGFVILFLCACGGAFIANDMTEAFIRDPAILEGWQLTLLKSAHGHGNLFGVLHVLFGLTLPYSLANTRFKTLQTAGLFMGSVAMGLGLIWRATMKPSADIDFPAIVLGILLSAALLALVSHAAGLGAKLLTRE